MHHLEEHPISSLLLRYSTPAVLGAVITAVYSIIDRIFVGWMIGPLGITAVTLSFPVMLMLTAFGMLIGVGSSVLISIRIGEKKIAAAEQIVGQAVVLFFSWAVLFAICVFFWHEEILRLFGASEAALPGATQYLLIITAGGFFHMVSFGVNSFLRSEGKPRLSMALLILAALLNVFFDWLFLCVCKTPVWGAAAATVLAQFITSCIIFGSYLSHQTLLRLRWRYLQFSFPLMREIAYLGSAAFVMQMAGCLVQMVANRQLNFYGNSCSAFAEMENGGDLAIAILGIIFAVGILLVMPLLGISQGLQPIAGYNLGANKRDRVRDVLLCALMYAFTFTFAMYAMILLVPQWLFAPFVPRGTPEADVLISVGTSALRIYLFGFPLVAVSIITAGYFQATGRPFYAMAITLTRQVLILVPLIFFLPPLLESNFGGSGINGVWFANPIADILAGCLAIFLLQHELRYVLPEIDSSAK